MPRCFDCQQSSPPNESGYTLIGEAGWRVTRSPAAGGSGTLEWRCPACWTKHKEENGHSSGTWSGLLTDPGKRSTR